MREPGTPKSLNYETIHKNYRDALYGAMEEFGEVNFETIEKEDAIEDTHSIEQTGHGVCLVDGIEYSMWLRYKYDASFLKEELNLRIGTKEDYVAFDILLNRSVEEGGSEGENTISVRLERLKTENSNLLPKGIAMDIYRSKLPNFIQELVDKRGVELTHKVGWTQEIEKFDDWYALFGPFLEENTYTEIPDDGMNVEEGVKNGWSRLYKNN